MFTYTQPASVSKGIALSCRPPGSQDGAMAVRHRARQSCGQIREAQKVTPRLVSSFPVTAAIEGLEWEEGLAIKEK